MKERRFAERSHLLFISFFVFLLFFLIILQFYRLQIIEGTKWTRKARCQHYRTVVEPFKRGRFFSNTSVKEGHPELPQAFVVDVPKFHLYIDPESIPLESKTVLAEKICSFFPFDDFRKKKMKEEFFLSSRSRKLVSWLDSKERESIEKWWASFAQNHQIARNALYFVPDFKRSYPFGALLGSVLHTLQDEKDPKTLQGIPTGGLELYFNHYLKGRPGKRCILRSPRHPLDLGTTVRKVEDGADVYLTINHYIQAIAESELEKGVKEAKAKCGWAVMLEPFTGEILALAQYPPFDLEHYSDFFTHPDKEELTRTKAVTDAFEPGSIFKPITLALALKASEELRKKGKPPIFSPQEKVATSDGHVPGRRDPLKDGSRVHHFLNMYLGVQKSSNVYMGKITQRLVERMGNEWYRDGLLSVFHFGKKTNIEVPGETSGMVPTPGKLHPNGTLEWSLSTPYSLAIGHNILINSLQMACAYAVFANGGFEVRPTLVRKIVRKKGELEEILVDHTEESRKKRKQVLSREICSEIVTALKFTTKPGGTSPRADIRGYTEAGKSGTSEKIINGHYSKEKYVSSFIGFAPVSKPRFVLIVTLEEPAVGYLPGFGKSHHGGVCATPIFREIGEKTLQYLGVTPDDPGGYPVGDHRCNVETADWIKENKQLKELYKQWNSH